MLGNYKGNYIRSIASKRSLYLIYMEVVPVFVLLVNTDSSCYVLAPTTQNCLSTPSASHTTHISQTIYLENTLLSHENHPSFCDVEVFPCDFSFRRNRSWPHYNNVDKKISWLKIRSVF